QAAGYSLNVNTASFRYEQHPGRKPKVAGPALSAGGSGMAVRWSRVAPQAALVPALAVTLTAFVGAIIWSVYLSFTASRRFPDYALAGLKQYDRLFNDDAWTVSLKNTVILGVGSLLSIVLGFLLAALIDKEIAGKALFRTIFLYPLAVSLIVTGIVWRWLFNPTL